MTVMALISKEVQFDAGHRVYQHKSKCRNLHGHRYRVVAQFVGPIQDDAGSDTGMVIDFGDIKDKLMMLHDKFDHKLVLSNKDPLVTELMQSQILEPTSLVIVPWVPTAENLAVHAYEFLMGLGLPVEKVQIYETPTSVAEYSGVS